MAASSKQSVYRKKRYERHGLTAGGKKPPVEYVAWTQMIQRCEDVNCPGYKDYGGRGVSVCSRWRASFTAFLSDVGNRPAPGYSLERKKNDGNYEPGNVVWATKKQQARNRRSSRFLEANGERLTLAEWAERLGCSHTSILGRIRRGMSEQDAVTVPVRGRQT